MLLSGMGELHLEILVDRLLREFKIQANVGKPQVSYRETLMTESNGRGQFEREVAGKMQKARVSLRVEPATRGSGVSFHSEVDAPELTREFLKAIETGSREASEVGAMAGYSLTDIKIALVDFEFFANESSALSYKIASSNALREALRAGKSQLLEPIFGLEILTPEDYMGNIIGDLNSRRGRVNSMATRAGLQVLEAEAPLKELFGYATDLRSMSQGRASFTMEFLQYDVVPPKVEKEILAHLGR